MTPEQLAVVVGDCIDGLHSEGLLDGGSPAEIVIERPKSKDHGDYATPVALVLAKSAGRPPRELAELIAGRLREAVGIADAEVAGPGFVNIRLAADAPNRSICTPRSLM